MRQVGDNCGKNKVGPFWHRLAGFLFLLVHYFLDLIANSISVLSATVGDGVINAVFVGERFVNARLAHKRALLFNVIWRAAA